MGKTSQQIPMPGGYAEQGKAAAAQGGPSSKEVFYSPASDQLVATRHFLCEYSFPRTHNRLLRTKHIRENEEEQRQEDLRAAALYVNMKELGLNGSQFGDDRPLSSVRFSPDSALVASGSWTGTVKLWEASTLNGRGTLVGHDERITSVAWQPAPTGGHAHLLASSSADGKVFLWDCRETSCTTGTEHMATDTQTHAHVDDMEAVSENDTPVPPPPPPPPNGARACNRHVSSLEGHQGVVSRCTFHPCGALIGTTGYDFTWRLWDVETSTELLLQDGHSKECNAIDFHHDGSLVLTGDLGGVALLWDLRSGQSVQVFQGHIKKIVSASFNVNGYMVATGSTDNNVKIWDLRSKKCGYTLPAHSNVICDARFSSSGEVLLTGSFDGTLKLWNTRNFDILKTLSGHAGKVMSCDIAPDESCLVSTGYDHTVKLWTKDI